MLGSNRTQARLACFIPTPSDTTSFQRGIGPLAAMQRRDHRLTLVMPRMTNDRPELTWDWLAQADVLFLQRPALPEHLACARQARTMGLKVWIDWDDDILAVRRSNPGFAMYARPDVQAAVRELAQLADAVTVSTVELSRSAARYGADPCKVTVVPNACPWDYSMQSRRRTVTWRGTKHHAESISWALPAIREIAHNPEFGDWDWHFLGDAPWEIFETIPGNRLKQHAGRGIYQYMELFTQLAPWVHLVPLAPNGFNRAKSNLAWLEASAAGAITIAPDWEEWQRPGIVNYADLEDFSTKLREVLHSYHGESPSPAPSVLASREFITRDCRPDQVNRLRWALLQRLLPE